MSSSRQMARRPSLATQWCGAPGPAWPSTRREAAAPHRFRRPEQRPSWVALSSTHGRPAAPSDTGLTSSLRWGPAEARRPVAQLRSQAQRPNWSTRPTRPDRLRPLTPGNHSSRLADMTSQAPSRPPGRGLEFAASRWRDFPVVAHPRPLVLTKDRPADPGAAATGGQGRRLRSVEKESQRRQNLWRRHVTWRSGSRSCTSLPRSTQPHAGVDHGAIAPLKRVAAGTTWEPFQRSLRHSDRSAPNRVLWALPGPVFSRQTRTFAQTFARFI